MNAASAYKEKTKFSRNRHCSEASRTSQHACVPRNTKSTYRYLCVTYARVTTGVDFIRRGKALVARYRLYSRVSSLHRIRPVDRNALHKARREEHTRTLWKREKKSPPVDSVRAYIFSARDRTILSLTIPAADAQRRDVACSNLHERQVQRERERSSAAAYGIVRGTHIGGGGGVFHLITLCSSGAKVRSSRARVYKVST